MADPVILHSNNGVSATASTTASFGFTAAFGSLLVLVVASDDYQTAASRSAMQAGGWVRPTGAAQETYLGHYLWYKIAAGGETSVTYAIGSASPSCWAIEEFSNVSAFNVSNGQASTTFASSYSTPAVVATAGRRLAIATVGFSSGQRNITGLGSWTNGYTEIADVRTSPGSGTQDAFGIASLVYDANGSASTSTTATEEYSGDESDRATAIIAVFNVATGGGAAAEFGGAATALSTVAAAIVAAIRAAGNALAAASTTGALTNAIRAQGGANVQAQATGALTAAITYQGAASAAAAASAMLAAGSSSFSGNALARSLANGALTTEIRLAGAVLGVATAAAPALAKNVVLGGSAVGSSQAAGGLAAFVTMAGSAAGVAAATGDMRPAVDLFWDAPAGWTPSGYRIKWGTASGVYGNFKDVGAGVLTTTLWGLQPSTVYYWRVVGLDAQGNEQTPSTEALFNTFPAATFGGAAVGIATAAGGMASVAVLGGAASGQALASGVLLKPIPLAGAAMTVAAASGGMVADIRMSGTALAQAIMQGQIGAPGATLAANAQAAALAAGNLTITAVFQAAAFGSAQAGGALTTESLLQGAAAAQSTAVGYLTAPVPMSGAAIAQAIAQGDLRMQIWFSGDAIADALSTGQLMVVPSLVGGAKLFTVKAERHAFRVRARALRNAA